MKEDRNISTKQSDNVITVRGEGNNKPMAKRVALRRAEEAAGSTNFEILEERYVPQGSGWWLFLTIRF